MHASLVPTATDLAALLGYVLGNPFLFISSSTVMTTGLVLGAVAMSLVPRGAPALRIAAPPLAMVLAYFGLGSMVLATEILVRFHGAIPDATETQFASGIGHLVEAAGRSRDPVPAPSPARTPRVARRERGRGRLLDGP